MVILQQMKSKRQHRHAAIRGMHTTDCIQHTQPGFLSWILSAHTRHSAQRSAAHTSESASSDITHDSHSSRADLASHTLALIAHTI